ncbi:phosphate acetyltransferase [Gayadomonas joobiniege]|uniref:phosphate acetyltransferase n=1 Tax=Gayadomonas joobiniege TaxID=1234606 RepID=UPI000377F2AD|nr:phosphate acetyltransferase [Gayadomonas joobiniege]
MKHSFFIAPTGYGTGLTSVCLGLVRALDRLGLSVAFCKPIAQHSGESTQQDPSLSFLKTTHGMEPPEPISLETAQRMLANGDVEQLMEEVVNLCEQSSQQADILIIEGLVPQPKAPFTVRLNTRIANTLDADVIMVAAKNELSVSEMNQQINLSANFYGGADSQKVLGCILNKVGAPAGKMQALMALDDGEVSPVDPVADLAELPVFKRNGFRLLGQIRYNPTLLAPRALDIMEHLHCDILNQNADLNRRVTGVSICARTVANMLHTLKAGTLVVTPGDRDDILLVACMAVMNGVPLAGILLTGGYKPEPAIMNLCQVAFETGLPLMLVKSNTYRTAQHLDEFNLDVPTDDIARIEQVMDSVAESIDMDWIASRAQVKRAVRLSPAAFRHQLVQKSRSNIKRIVLPEGEEIRTIQAAIISAQKGIARCVLLGEEEAIRRTAKSLTMEIPEAVEIISPSSISENYVTALMEKRKHKGLTEDAAREMLEDTVVLGTMMLAEDDVDGLVSGAVNTTANTIRPALQLIKTQPGSKIVSSVFFMCLPEQVLVYGDCAVNPDPSAEELADIAIQSGDSAIAFGIEPRIAMISYSTGASGIGSDVDKVRQATAIAKEKRPDLLIDGPLQYDAASVASVAAKKAPDSPVAGKATVFVFPDLNTGNTTYKAVQRSANVVSIGPMLQGLKKPVNDLSRGALVEDIIYTIALTSIQAQNR